jgi:putative spermidine/putrescine transport system permease protein
MNPGRLRSRWEVWVLLGPAVLVLVVFLGIPLLAVAQVSLSPGAADPRGTTGLTLSNYQAFFAEEFYVGVLGTTLLTSAGATLITLLIAYPFALYMTFGVDRARRYLVLAILSPLLISGVVRSYAMVYLLGPGNPVDELLPSGLTFDLLYTRAGVMVGLAHSLIPFMVLSLVASLSNVDARVVAAARSLGAGTFTVLWRVVVPLSAPGILAGCLIVFNLAITSFAAPLLLGGAAYKMLVSLIYPQVLLLFNWPFGFAIGLILLGFSLASMYIATRLGSRAQGPLVG